jgi:hypothetical protein
LPIKGEEMNKDDLKFSKGDVIKMKKLFGLIICCIILCSCNCIDQRRIEEQLSKDCNYSETLKIIDIERLNDYQLPPQIRFIFSTARVNEMNANLAKNFNDYYLYKKLTKKELINIIDSIEIVCNNYVNRFEEVCFLWDGSYDTLHKDTIIPVIDGSKNYRLTVTDGHREIITYAKIYKDGSIETSLQIPKLIEEYFNAENELYNSISKYKSTIKM